MPRERTQLKSVLERQEPSRCAGVLFLRIQRGERSTPTARLRLPIRPAHTISRPLELSLPTHLAPPRRFSPAPRLRIRRVLRLPIPPLDTVNHPEPSSKARRRDCLPYAPALAGTLQSRGMAASAGGPTHRNALMTWLLPFIVIVGGGTVATILSFVVPRLALIAPLAELAGSVWFLVLAIAMVGEVRSVTRNTSFAWWPILVPIYGMYWAWILVPQEVAKAKRLVGLAKPPQHIVLYIFLWPFALATDINRDRRPKIALAFSGFALGAHARQTVTDPEGHTLNRKCITSPSRTT